MAGDWIKMSKDLPDKPEVWQMAARLNIDADAVVGKLLRVWSWFDSNTFDGNAESVSFSLVDRVAGVFGFAESMMLSGWLKQSGTTLSIPNFERHNGKTAKNRALTNERVSRHREKTNAQGVTESVTKTVTREEKRREEEIKPPTPLGCVFPVGFDSFWAAYPRKTAKPQAIKAFARLAPDAALLSAMLAALTVQRQSEQWRKDNGQFIPHPSTWLNGRRWEDQMSANDDPFGLRSAV